MNPKFHLFLPALCGAAGGAANAFLCYQKIPVRVENFAWHIVPAGALHGAVLALIAVGLASKFYSALSFRWWLGFLLAGYAAGWLSWIPISFSAFRNPVLKSVFWPVGTDDFGILWGPYHAFGLVSAIYYLVLTRFGVFQKRNLAAHLAAATVSGVLGSLWFWIIFSQWYLALLHGAVWGIPVGFSVWRSRTLHDR